jgi:hypothetical protein
MFIFAEDFLFPNHKLLINETHYADKNFFTRVALHGGIFYPYPCTDIGDAGDSEQGNDEGAESEPHSKIYKGGSGG